VSRLLGRLTLRFQDADSDTLQLPLLGLIDHALLKDVGAFRAYSPRALWVVSDKLNTVRLMILNSAGHWLL